MILTNVKKLKADLSIPSFLDVILGMTASQWTFQLTGSRFFKTENRDSDWDFFVQESDDIREFLSSFKMRRKTNDVNDYHGDPNIAEVWESFDGKIQIQLVRDFHHKMRAQNYLKNLHSFFIANIYKNPSEDKQRNIMKAFWDDAFAATRPHETS